MYLELTDSKMEMVSKELGYGSSLSHHPSMPKPDFLRDEIGGPKKQVILCVLATFPCVDK